MKPSDVPKLFRVVCKDLEDWPAHIQPVNPQLARLLEHSNQSPQVRAVSWSAANQVEPPHLAQFDIFKQFEVPVPHLDRAEAQGARNEFFNQVQVIRNISKTKGFHFSPG